MNPIVIIDNFDSFTYNLYQMVQAVTQAPVEVYRNNATGFDELVAKKPSRVILSPGPGHPAKEKDFGVCAPVITQWEQLSCPVLGVCLGHQGMVHYLGGQVIQAPEIVHGKSSQIKVLEPTPLFDGLPNPFEAMRYHSLVGADEQFPDELKITARDTQHNLIMALVHRSKPLYGVQFHPESIGTPTGQQMLKNFVEKC